MAQISSALKREIGEIAFILLASHEHVKSVAALVSGPDLVKPIYRERGAGNQVRKNSNSESVIWAKRARPTLTAT